MRVWEKVHHLISNYLHKIYKDPLSKKDISNMIEQMLADMDIQYERSKHKDYETYDKNNKFWLSEHFYKQNIDDNYKLWKEKIKKQFNNFLKSEIHEKILWHIKDGHKLFIEQQNIDFEQMKIVLDAVPELMWITLRAQPDFGVIINDWNYIIYDWKSWKIPTYPAEYISDQLKVYAYKMLNKLWFSKYTDIKISAYEFYLDESKTYWWDIYYDEILNIQNKIIEDVSFEKKFIQNWEIERNIPLATHYFPRTDRAKKCQVCRFRKVCEDLKHYEPQDIDSNRIEKISEPIEEIPF